MIETQILKAATEGQNFLNRMEIPSPDYLFASLLGVQGTELYMARRHFEHQRRRVDRDCLLFPEVALADPVSRSVKSICDMFRQSFGSLNSPNFDDQGNWIASSE